MMNMRTILFRFGLIPAVVFVVGAVVYGFIPKKPTQVEFLKQPEPLEQVQLVPGERETIRVPLHVIKALGVKTFRVEEGQPPAPLRLEGSLFPDPNRLTHVHTRFPGEVVEIGLIEGPSDEPERRGELVQRPIRFGDTVHKNQLLAVVWSKDLGEKKSELIDAWSRLFLDQETLKRLDELYKTGAIPERSLREAERNVESDLIAVRNRYGANPGASPATGGTGATDNSTAGGAKNP